MSDENRKQLHSEAVPAVRDAIGYTTQKKSCMTCRHRAGFLESDHPHRCHLSLGFWFKVSPNAVCDHWEREK